MPLEIGGVLPMWIHPGFNFVGLDTQIICLTSIFLQAAPEPSTIPMALIQLFMVVRPD